MTDDQQLLAKAKEFDPAALQTFHQRFYGLVRHYIQFKVGDIHTVEDLTEEVFVRALEGLKQDKAWRDSPKGWIMGIARNVVAGYYRQRAGKSEVALDEQLSSTEEFDPVHQAALNERKRLLRQAIQELTDEQRDVILMRFMEGINIAGVAKAIDKSPGAVKTLQHRALRILAKKMGNLSPEKIDYADE